MRLRKLTRKEKRLNRRQRRKQDRAGKIGKEREKLQMLIREKNGRNQEHGIALDAGPLEGTTLASQKQMDEVLKRVSELELNLSRTKIEVSDLREAQEQVEDEIAQELDMAEESKEKADGVWSAAAVSVLAALQPLIGIVNMGDKVQSPAALAAGRALQAASGQDILSQSQRAWAQAAATLLEGFAYFDARAGLQSLMAKDSGGDAPIEVMTGEAAAVLLGRLIDSLEGIRAVLESSETTAAIEAVSSGVTELSRSISGTAKENPDALVPALKHLNHQIDNLSQSVS